MSRVVSEVLFNRAILWALGARIMREQVNELLSWILVLLSAHSVWKSYVEWGNGE